MAVAAPSARAFIASMLRQGVLRLGEFTLKSGRASPYFFNLGLVAGGPDLAELGRWFARAIGHADLPCDVLFGPAYKGIPLATATAIALAEQGRDVAIAYNRKQAKAHGEGGLLVGAPLAGDVLMIDDVVTDGGTKLEAARMIEASGARLAGLVIALDRQESGAHGDSAVNRLSARFKAPVVAIATLDDIIEHLDIAGGPEAEHLDALRRYRETCRQN